VIQIKITRPTLNILLDEVKKLGPAIEELEGAAKEWTEKQEWRDNGYNDQYWTQLSRDKLERRLIEFRKVLAKVYDTQGDKGLM
jgi:hypothetical protein